MTPTITYLCDIYFEAGISQKLPSIADRYAIRRPLFVTDPGIIQAGLLANIGLEPAAVFSDVQTNPTEKSVLAGLSLYHESRCDSIIAIGGGSPMDCAKGIALLAAHPPPLAQYALINGGLAKITSNRPPLFCIPTTAGTGSEVGRGALITLATGQKLALISPHLIPTAAVCDPLLTLGLPPLLTAATGMDAISHCIETFCSPKFNPVAESIALDGLVRASKNISAATHNGSNIQTRSEMLMAALQGGLTFQKGLGAIHALSHPLGSIEHRRLHHGTLNSIFIPHVLRFNLNSCREKLQRIAQALNLDDPAALPAYFEKLSQSLGLPARLRDLGTTRDEVLEQTQSAYNDHSRLTNPREMTVNDCRILLEAAY